jgi:hypothetical protein
VVFVAVQAPATDLAKARAVRVAKATQRAIDLAPTIEALRSTGANSLRSLAASLNAQGITAPRGGAWSAAQVRNALVRITHSQAGAGAKLGNDELYRSTA